MNARPDVPNVRTADLIAKLFAGYDTPYGAKIGDTMAAKVDGYFAAARGQRLDIVERAVDDFLGGAVERKATKRSMLPTSDEFGAHIRLLAKVSAANVGGEAREHAPPAGPLWGVELIVSLLAGPDAGMPAPTAFIATMIAVGGETGERYRRQHRANNGFRKVSAMLQMAADAKGCAVRASLTALTGMMEPVPIGSETFTAWRQEFDRRGWPWLPDLGKHRVVYFPKGGPAGLAAFEAAL